MSELVPGKNGGKLNRFTKGESGNPKGRPRKVISKLKLDGYKLAEINDTIQIMVSMTFDELKKIWDSPDATILEKTIAAALRKSLSKGELDSVETLLNRVYGKPKNDVDITSNGQPIKININLND
jgi:hypothetical protein